MDGRGRVALRRSRDRTAGRRRCDPRARVPREDVRDGGGPAGGRRATTGGAGHVGVPDGHELHVRAAQDARVPGRVEQAAPDTVAGRVRDGRADAARGRPHARHQRAVVGRPRFQRRPVAVRARRLRGPQHRQGPRAQDHVPEDRRSHRCRSYRFCNDRDE